MRHYEPFSPSGLSFRERIGEPDEVSAALGLIAINFQELEETLAAAIARRLGAEARKARTVSAELSFSRRLNLLAALARDERSVMGTPDSYSSKDDELGQLIALCAQAEDLRNQYIHSVWPARHYEGTRAVRIKRTAKRRGFREVNQEVTAGQLLDVAEYIAYVCTMVEQFFDLSFGVADGE